MIAKRDPGIDFWKGIAALSIIHIHTVWWSGTSYVPEWCRSLSLMVDVPLFMFLAGWGASLSEKTHLGKSLIRVGKTLINYVLILLILHGVEFGMTGTAVSPPGLLREALLLDYPALPSFPVFAEQLWFMRMWVPVTVIGHVLLCLTEKLFAGENREGSIGTILAVLGIGIALFSVGTGSTRTGLDRTICFYLFFFFLGCGSRSFSFPSWRAFLATLAALAASYAAAMYLTGMRTFNLQEVKFPPHLLYAIASLVSISLVLFCRGRMEKVMNRCRGLRYMGRNALCFYFSQGVGSSLLMTIAPRIQAWRLPWAGTWLICLLINLAISIPGGMLLAKCYQVFWRAIEAVFKSRKK